MTTAVDRRPSVLAWLRSAFIPSGGGPAAAGDFGDEARSEVISGNAPASTWQMLLKSWGYNPGQVTDETIQSIPAYNRAIEIIASQVASLPFDTYRSLPEGGSEVAEDHPLHDLLSFRVHPLVNSYDWRVAVIRQLLTKGECFVVQKFVGGDLRQLQTYTGARPEIVERRGNYFYILDGVAVASEEVLHFKINTADGLRGQSAVHLYQDTLDRAAAIISLDKAYFGNAGQVSGLLSPEQPMNPKQAEQALTVWNSSNVGREKAGKIGMLPWGFKFIKIGSNRSDNQMKEARLGTLQDVSNMTGVDPLLLGSMEGTTFNNVEESNRKLVQFTLRPYLKLIEDEMNSKCFSREERRRLYVRFNVDGLLRGDTKSRGDYYLKMRNAGAISPNEIRAMENMSPYEGGDRYDLPLASNQKPDQKSDSSSAQQSSDGQQE
jgi:HK97 family phage portal protein